MKNYIVLLVLAFCFTLICMAQDVDTEREFLGLGVHAGATIGDFSNSYSSNFGLDFYYLRAFTGRILEAQ